MYHFQSPPPRILRQFCTAEDDGGPSKSSISGRAEMATTPPPPDTSSVAPGFDVTSFLALDEIQREKRISETQRALRAAYKQGDHSSALEGAKLLRDQCALHFTRNHPAYASALNDLGLMHKELGEHAFAVEAYLEALRVYRAAFGMENHPSFATTLANCGLAFRAYAAGCPALERMGLLDRAKEHLERAVELRREVSNTIANFFWSSKAHSYIW
jgi:tetratricopeptide (TPR) repeat protein